MTFERVFMYAHAYHLLETNGMLPQELSPKVIAQTSEWFVIDKPAGWLSIPGRTGESGPAPVASTWAEQELGSKIWVVHRIDRETSGVLLFAKNADAHRKANLWFEHHEVKKTYQFLAAGSPREPIFKVRSAIEGAPSSTQFEVRERFGHGFLGIAHPQSGRRHQIRIHLAGEGFPILGDTRYKGPSTLAGAQFARVALHASQLALPGGERFEAGLPQDFSLWLENLRGLANGSA